MGRNIAPPTSDDQIARHQFYAELSMDIREIDDDVNGLGRKLTRVFERVDMIGDKLKEFSTRGNTIIACISVLWFVLGSGLTMYVNSVIEEAKKTIATVNDLEKRMFIVESEIKNNEPHIESIEKIKRNLSSLQQEVQGMQGKQQ